uniref:nitrate regulatory gene2 protein-like n=1 Tax=Erigeron canadensis TaxID=72917 RepID=UPI001CB988D3|nr:nitrate regulatory gene2 protein-like [Erigeron canadensis]
MGCGASKVDDSALVKKSLVKKCRERKRLMKNAVDYRYELSKSHVAYFHSLKDMGHTLSRFVDEQLDIPPSSAPDDVVESMPPSGSNSILSLDFHGHTGIHDAAAADYHKKFASAKHTVIQPKETRGSVGDAVLTSIPPYTILSSDFTGHDSNGHVIIHDDQCPPTAAAYYRNESAPPTGTTVIQPMKTRGWVEDAYVDESIGTSRMRAEGIPDELEEELTESESHTSSCTNTSTSRRKPTRNKQHSMDVEGKKGKSLAIDDEGYSTTEIEVSAHATSRDLQEVFKEIKDEFEAAFSYGEQVALMLDAGKLPYQSKFHVLKGNLSKILGLLAPSSTTSSSRSRVTELAGSYDVYDVPDKSSLNLSSTLEKLYMWEKKLYKQVNDAERLRVMYQRMLKRLTELEPCRANSRKIHAAQASIERSRHKLDISMKLIDAISSEIHQVRDMELQPQVSKLIDGMIGMWQSIGKGHRKQLEAIKEGRSLTLRANTSMERDSSLGTTLELETRLLTWAQHFNSWMNAQKSFVGSLNGWLLQFNIDHEPEINTDGGEVPFSPGQSGAPPIFIICNDWRREINGVSQEQVTIAMNKFALKLRQLLETEDEIQRLSKNQVDLDHKKAMKIVENVGAGTLEDGVIPIFKALENFSRDVLKAHKHVRLQ